MTRPFFSLSIEAVDAERELVYFSGNQGGHTEKHLFVASFAPANAGVRRLTVDSGWHVTAVSAAAGVFVDVFSSIDQPPTTRLYRLPSLSPAPPSDPVDAPTLLAVLSDSAQSDTRLTALLPALPAPRLDRLPLPADPLPLTGEAGGLHCALYLPDEARFGPGPYPTVVSVYGGPGPQRVNNMWQLRVDLRAQRLAQDGYLGECESDGH